MLNLFLQRTDILFGYFAEFFYFLGIKLIIDILNLFENALFMVLIHLNKLIDLMNLLDLLLDCFTHF